MRVKRKDDEMRRVALLCGMVFLLTVVGCAFLQRVAPSAVDETGAVVPGTHALTQQAKSVVDNLGPYGQAATAIPLLIWNFVELVRAKRDQKGLIATVKALKQASDDPKTQEAFDQIKEYLKNAHNIAGVQPEIKNILAKL